LSEATIWASREAAIGSSMCNLTIWTRFRQTLGEENRKRAALGVRRDEAKRPADTLFARAIFLVPQFQPVGGLDAGAKYGRAGDHELRGDQRIGGARAKEISPRLVSRKNQGISVSVDR
jgi:hypothetical protein